MTDLPSGTVTFLFTDIEGSTRLWEEYHEAMKRALGRHDAVLRAAIGTNRGHIFKTVGDAFDAVFPTAPGALAAALAAQRALSAEPWEVPGGLRVRMALDTGVAEERDEDYFGPTLNRTARLLAAAHGGQILLSRTTFELVRDALPADVTLRDLGEHRLKDLTRPERIFQVVASDVPGDFPSIKSLNTLPNNLPIQLTSFVGREREIASVKHHLAADRLVTLTGAGGAGKTRLALQVAAELLESYQDGVWLVQLESLADPALVPQTVASAVGVREEHRPLVETVADFLHPKSLLLVVDNCEHLLVACAQLAETFLRRCPQLRVLATSQEPLGVAGEATYRVPSLSMPDAKQAPDPESLTQYEAVRLFAERAALSKRDFALTGGNALAVAQLVRRLDGIPLAIELAAARLKALSVEQIVARLDDRFRLLTAGTRTAVARHQTLKATMDWSYELLSEAERAMLRRVSVFAGGWTLEAAETVCSGEGIEPREVLDLLALLVDKSMVLVYEEDHGGPRYRLLETVRQYGRERLVESGEDEAVGRRHRDWYLRSAEEAEPGLQEPQQEIWLDRLEAEHDNLRAALEWCRTREDNPEYGLRLAGALWKFWEVRGYWSEGRAWLEGTLARSGELMNSQRVKGLNGAAYLAFFQGDYERAAALGEESLALSRKLGDKRGTASCLNILGLEACRLERYDRAAALGEESLALSREVGDRWGVADAHAVMGLVARGQGDYTRAAALLEESLAQARQLGDKWRVAIVLNNLGLVAREQGDYDRAKTLLEETLAQFRLLGDKWGIAFSQSNLGIVAWNQGDHERAELLFRESLLLRRALGDKRGITTSLVGLAAVAAARGQAERSALLFGAAEALREAIRVPVPPFIRDEYDRRVAALRATMREQAFTEAWAEGRAMSMDRAIAAALGEPLKA